MSDSQGSIVITGLGVISPLGNSPEQVWDALIKGQSGVTRLGDVYEHLPTKVAGQSLGFTGDISQFGELEKTLHRSIKKGLKLMCRDIQMGVAAAQLAVNVSRVMSADPEAVAQFDRQRVGVLFGCDHILSIPEEFTNGVRACLTQDKKFDFDQWAQKGLPKVDPLWLLKYLPNMPACHFAIYHDLQGPNNSLTVREASSNMAIAEAHCTLARGSADVMVVGGTGARVHASRSVHMALQEQIALGDGDPSAACRPFAADRSGMVLGEGAGAMVMETQEYAEKRGARILGRVLAGASSTVADQRGVPNFRKGFENVMRSLLQQSGMAVGGVGHVHAHGLGTTLCDQQEAEAINAVFGPDKPVVAAKSFMGNLGAGGGLVEAISSILAMQHGELFAGLNCQNMDPSCKINLITKAGADPGTSFINLSMTPQGQASGVLIAKA